MTPETEALRAATSDLGQTPPTRHEVCSTCHGHGSTSAHLGAFTADDLWALGNEFREDYAAGWYDRPCPDCEGLRVVLVLDEDRASPAEYRAYVAALEAAYEAREPEFPPGYYA